MSKKWNVIHDCDGENGEPTVWSLEINHPDLESIAGSAIWAIILLWKLMIVEKSRILRNVNR